MDEPSSSKQSFTRALPRPDVSNEAEVIDSIEASFFIEEDFDAVEYELKKLVGVQQLCMDDVDRERAKLKGQLQVVSKKISTLILEKAPSYSSQMDDVVGIRDELGEVIRRVKTVRRYLAECKSKSSYAMGVLANHRQKSRLVHLKDYLDRLKTLRETEYKMHEFLEEGKFPLAIRVCTDALEAAQSYSTFDCVRELSDKLQSCYASLESSLDAALASLVCAFDPDRYLLVYNAYRLLGKQEEAAGRLVAFTSAALERRARQTIVAEVVQVHPETACDTLAYEKLCELLPADRVASGLRQLGYALCQILASVHAVLAVHAEEAERERTIGDEGTNHFARQLSASLYSIFRTALVRFNTLLCCQDFAQLKFDDVLTVVELATKFRSFGRRHFGHAAVEINVSLEKQSALFFTRQHAEKMEEMRMFLENEAFAVVPLPANFSLFDLQEFAFMRSSREERGSTASHKEEGIGEQLDFSPLAPDAPNPFGGDVNDNHKSCCNGEAGPLSPRANGHSSSSSCPPSPSPLPSDTPESGPSPNLCNTALVVLRLLGRYIRMTMLLHSVADRSIPAIVQLFEYFLFSVVAFFARDGTEFVEPVPPRLETVLAEIDRKLFLAPTSFLPHPSVCCGVQLQFADSLFALPERVVAIESLEFVGRQLDLTRPVIESLIAPDDEKSARVLAEFYAKVLSAVPDVRLAIMNAVASRALKLPLLISTISTTQWSVNELQSKHSTYVDFLLQDLEVFSLRLQHLSIDQPFDVSLRDLLWDRTIRVALKAIVHGYSLVGGKCTNEGRALMQLDIQHLSGRLEKMTGRKMADHIAYVDAYVKAYYLPELHLEEWAVTHAEYTVDQIQSLLQAASHVSKKTRTRILNTLNANQIH